MNESAAPARRGRLRRAAAFVDPAEPGFGERMVRLFVAGLLVAIVVGVIGSLIFVRSSFGRYSIAFVNYAYLRRPAAAEESMRALVAEQPGRRYAPYALLASSLAAQRRGDEALEVMAEVMRLFPRDERGLGKYCRYGSLFRDPEPVLEACDRAVEILPNAFNYERRASARALAGDTEGALSDLRQLARMCAQSGEDRRRCRVRAAWLEAMESGQNPFVEGARPR